MEAARVLSRSMKAARLSARALGRNRAHPAQAVGLRPYTTLNTVTAYAACSHPADLTDDPGASSAAEHRYSAQWMIGAAPMNGFSFLIHTPPPEIYTLSLHDALPI